MTIPHVFEVRLVMNGKVKQSPTLTVDIPPSANVYWRFNPGGSKPYPSKKAEEYKKLVGWEWRAKQLEYGDLVQAEPFTGGCALQVHFFLNHVSRDLSNCIKILEDALQGFAFVDDNQVDRIIVSKSFDYENPRAEVIVWEISSKSAAAIAKQRKRPSKRPSSRSAKSSSTRRKTSVSQSRRSPSTAATGSTRSKRRLDS